MNQSIANVAGRYNVDIAHLFEEYLIDDNPLSHPSFIGLYIERLPSCNVGIPHLMPKNKNDAIRVAEEFINIERKHFASVIKMMLLSDDWQIAFDSLKYLHKVIWTFYHSSNGAENHLNTFTSTNKFLQFDLPLINRRGLAILEDGNFWVGLPPAPKRILVSRSYPFTNFLGDKFAHLCEIDTLNIQSLGIENPFTKVVKGEYSQEVMNNITSCIRNTVFNDKVNPKVPIEKPTNLSSCIPELITQVPPLANIWEILTSSKTKEFSFVKDENGQSEEAKVRDALFNAGDYFPIGIGRQKYELNFIIGVHILPLNKNWDIKYWAQLLCDKNAEKEIISKRARAISSAIDRAKKKKLIT